MVETVIMSSEEIQSSLRRMAHETVEKNGSLDELLLVGIRTRGVPLATRLAASIGQLADLKVPIGALDISLYRDDLASAPLWPLVLSTEIPVEITKRNVVIVDDVLYTGRSVRAALDALTHLGRPKRIQLAVLVDRGHRELPIRADFVGKNIPTSKSETVKVRLKETDGHDAVVLIGHGAPISAGRGGS